MLKYFIASVPLVLCIELVSYVCLTVIAVMVVWDILQTMYGKW